MRAKEQSFLLGRGPRSGGEVAKPSNEYQTPLIKPDNFVLTKGGGD